MTQNQDVKDISPTVLIAKHVAFVLKQEVNTFRRFSSTNQPKQWAQHFFKSMNNDQPSWATLKVAPRGSKGSVAFDSMYLSMAVQLLFFLRKRTFVSGRFFDRYPTSLIPQDAVLECVHMVSDQFDLDFEVMDKAD